MICPCCGLQEALDYFYLTVNPDKVACPDCGHLFDPSEEGGDDEEGDE